MFDFAWSELALIGVVALVLIGPKDMPVAVKGVTDAIKKLRRMAGEFQHHVDDMMREADMHEVRRSIQDLRSFDIRSQVRRAIDPDRSIARSLDDPFRAPMTTMPPGPVVTPPPQGVADGAPDFVPPSAALRVTHAREPAVLAPDPAPDPVPDFVPPSRGAHDA